MWAWLLPRAKVPLDAACCATAGRIAVIWIAAIMAVVALLCVVLLMRGPGTAFHHICSIFPVR
jgi:hypothetical protein